MCGQEAWYQSSKVQRTSLTDVMESKMRNGEIPLNNDGLQRALLDAYRENARLKDEMNKKKKDTNEVCDGVH